MRAEKLRNQRTGVTVFFLSFPSPSISFLLCLGQSAKSKRMKIERELVKGGKKPFYLKESDAKTLELVEQFNQAKQDGSLEKKVRTKRKRNESKVRTSRGQKWCFCSLRAALKLGLSRHVMLLQCTTFLGVTVLLTFALTPPHPPLVRTVFVRVCVCVF